MIIYISIIYICISICFIDHETNFNRTSLDPALFGKLKMGCGHALKVTGPESIFFFHAGPMKTHHMVTVLELQTCTKMDKIYIDLDLECLIYPPPPQKKHEHQASLLF